MALTVGAVLPCWQVVDVSEYRNIYQNCQGARHGCVLDVCIPQDIRQHILVVSLGLQLIEKYGYVHMNWALQDASSSTLMYTLLLS